MIVTWQVETPVVVAASVQVPVIVSPESEFIPTVPVGELAPVAASSSVTVTVAVLAWFTTTELGLNPTDVLVWRVTVCISAGEVLVSKVAVPAKTAVIECEPGLNCEAVVVNVAIPVVASAVPVPSGVVPSRNVTSSGVVSVGAGATVAVKVTGVPEPTGLSGDKVVVVGVRVMTGARLRRTVIWFVAAALLPLAETMSRLPLAFKCAEMMALGEEPIG